MTEREFSAPATGGEIVGWVSGSGPPALLLHGGPGMNDYLPALALELSPVMTVARYQQRGLSPSVTSGDRSVDGHVADAVSVMDALGWESAWVIGHSWGGHLAMHVAVARPERVAGLAVLDALEALPDGGAAALGEHLTKRLSRAERAHVEDYYAREEAGGGSAAESLEAFRMVWPFYFGNPDAAPPMPETRMDLEGQLATWASINKHFEDRTLEAGLPGLNMPVLVLHGDASPIPAAEAEPTAALIPGVRLTILDGIGHFAWLERPGSVRQEMEAMLA
ncbi:MAG: alpha/beta hydrolase [Chloroflexota bacterium]|nr:alpha/beta hydrolase [Chloroflexota bacterium]